MCSGRKAQCNKILYKKSNRAERIFLLESGILLAGLKGNKEEKKKRKEKTTHFNLNGSLQLTLGRKRLLLLLGGEGEEEE